MSAFIYDAQARRATLIGPIIGSSAADCWQQRRLESWIVGSARRGPQRIACLFGGGGGGSCWLGATDSLLRARRGARVRRLCSSSRPHIWHVFFFILSHHPRHSLLLHSMLHLFLLLLIRCHSANRRGCYVTSAALLSPRLYHLISGPAAGRHLLSASSSAALRRRRLRRSMEHAPAPPQ